VVEIPTIAYFATVQIEKNREIIENSVVAKFAIT